MANKSTTYSPRWLYAFFSWIKRTPGNGWLIAVVWLVGLAVLYQWRAWQLGLLPQGETHIFLLATGYWSVIFIFMLMNLDKRAESSLEEFGSSTGLSNKEIASLTHRFISVPEKETILAMLIVMPIFLSITIVSYPRSFPGLFMIYPILTVLLTLMINSMLTIFFLFRTFRQLRMVQNLYREMPKVSLFNQTPIYALSRYTGWVAFMLLTVFLLGTYIITPEVMESNLILFSMFGVFGLLIFILPLREVRLRLSHEKGNYEARLNRQLETVFEKTQHAVDQGKSVEIPELEISARSIRDQLDFVHNMSTLPWNPGTLRTVLIPIVLPIVLAIMQAIISNWMGL